MVDKILNYINPKKSKFTKTTDKYTKDSIFDIIDIKEAIIKNKFIKKCEKDKFIYCDYLIKENKKKYSLRIDDYFFEKDNGTIEQFTEFFEVISFLGIGAFGSVIRAYDKTNKSEVAIKVIYR